MRAEFTNSRSSPLTGRAGAGPQANTEIFIKTSLTTTPSRTSRRTRTPRRTPYTTLSAHHEPTSTTLTWSRNQHARARRHRQKSRAAITKDSAYCWHRSRLFQAGAGAKISVTWLRRLREPESAHVAAYVIDQLQRINWRPLVSRPP